MSDVDKKEVIKEALKEWMDDKFAQFGRWSFYSFGAAVLFALIIFILKTNGWSIARDPALVKPGPIIIKEN